MINSGCNRLKKVALDLFNRCGWRLHNRLTIWCTIKLVSFFVGSFIGPSYVTRDLYTSVDTQ
jgi:hypothetical protein